jgi:ABC-type Na+ transport system ATPase subunit NatA/ABC-type polysaccharide/polyol phosphate export permease
VTDKATALFVDRLTKVYGDGTHALDALDLRLPAGSFFGLLGPNGAGKTTLIGSVAGLVRAPAGRIFVFGHDAVVDARARVLLGLAPQEIHLDRFLTAREVLVYHGRYFGMRKRDAEERADELLEVFDLAAKAKAKPRRLSGGMRRRLLIARALVHRPRLAMLDEPTAGVDLELRHELWRYLRKLHGDEGLTVLLTTLTAVLFLAVFGGALGDRIREIEGIPYLAFILPGLLVMTVASQTFANNSTSLFQAKSEGYIEDVLTSPIRPWQLVLAYMAGGLVRGFAAAVAVALLAMPFAGRLERPGVAVAALLLTGLIFSLLGVVTGLWAETFDQHSFVAGIVITPLALVGGVFYSARTLGEPWETLTRFDPIYYLVDATRAGMTGVHESPVWISLAVVGIVTVATFVVTAAFVARGWRMKA